MNPGIIEKYRIKNKLSCTELCSKMGKTGGWYSRIRSGKHPLRNQYIPEMAAIFGIRPETLAKQYFSDSKLEDTSGYNETA